MSHPSSRLTHKAGSTSSSIFMCTDPSLVLRGKQMKVLSIERGNQSKKELKGYVKLAGMKPLLGDMIHYQEQKRKHDDCSCT